MLRLRGLVLCSSFHRAPRDARSRGHLAKASLPVSRDRRARKGRACRGWQALLGPGALCGGDDAPWTLTCPGLRRFPDSDRRLQLFWDRAGSMCWAWGAAPGTAWYLRISGRWDRPFSCPVPQRFRFDSSSPALLPCPQSWLPSLCCVGMRRLGVQVSWWLGWTRGSVVASLQAGPAQGRRTRYVEGHCIPRPIVADAPWSEPLRVLFKPVRSRSA